MMASESLGAAATAYAEGSGRAPCQNRLGYGCAERANARLKNVWNSWYLALVGFEAPNKMQPEEHSTGGGMDGAGYECAPVSS